MTDSVFCCRQGPVPVCLIVTLEVWKAESSRVEPNRGRRHADPGLSCSSGAGERPGSCGFKEGTSFGYPGASGTSSRWLAWPVIRSPALHPAGAGLSAIAASTAVFLFGTFDDPAEDHHRPRTGGRGRRTWPQSGRDPGRGRGNDRRRSNNRVDRGSGAGIPSRGFWPRPWVPGNP